VKSANVQLVGWKKIDADLVTPSCAVKLAPSKPRSTRVRLPPRSAKSSALPRPHSEVDDAIPVLQPEDPRRKSAAQFPKKADSIT
jgi:microcompartment protein CcmL/EutN